MLLTTGDEVADDTGRRWSVAPPGTIVEVDADTAAELGSAAREVAEAFAGQRLDTAELLIAAESAARRCGGELLSELARFRLCSSDDGALLIRGLVLDDPLPVTPTDGAFSAEWSEVGVSTVTQLMVMSVLGSVIAYADEKNGRLIQDVCPVAGAERRQENTGSSLLELHTEDGFHPHRPDFVSLLGLRGDHDGTAITVAGGVRRVLSQLDGDTLAALREPLFRMRVPSSFVGHGDAVYADAMPVLSGAIDDPELCVNFYGMESGEERGTAALAALREAMLGVLVGARLAPGDLLILDNRKAVHGRTGFTPRYDGTDRWVRRCFAVADIGRVRGFLYDGTHVHRPYAEFEGVR